MCVFFFFFFVFFCFFLGGGGGKERESKNEKFVRYEVGDIGRQRKTESGSISGLCSRQGGHREYGVGGSLWEDRGSGPLKKGHFTTCGNREGWCQVRSPKELKINLSW